MSTSKLYPSAPLEQKKWKRSFSLVEEKIQKRYMKSIVSLFQNLYLKNDNLLQRGKS